MLIIILLLITIFIALKYADWKNWKQYQSTMLLFSLGNMFYGFVYHDHFLWKVSSTLINHHTTELILTFSIFPLTVLIYLSGLPVKFNRRVLHVLKYTIIYSICEIILLKVNYISYYYGWSLWHSMVWDTVMFTIFAVHFKKPLLGYSLSGLLIIAMNLIFPFKLD